MSNGKCTFEFIGYPKCNENVYPGYDKCIFHLPKKEIYNDNFIIRDFSNAIEDYIGKRINYNEIKFYGFQFINFKLHGKNFAQNTTLNFEATEFHGDTSFRHCIIENEINFSGAKFVNGSLQFDSNTVNGSCSFAGTKGLKSLSIYDTTFNKVILTGININDLAISYSRINSLNMLFIKDLKHLWFFSNQINVQAIFSGYAEFINNNLELKFVRNILRDNSIILFENINLSDASFINTNIQDISFANCKWYEPKELDSKREIALWDEFESVVSGEPPDYSSLANNYSQLVLNFDKRRDFKTAEQFHIGEMECLRKRFKEKCRKKWYKKPLILFNSYNFYRLLSTYGTNYWLAFGWLILILFLSPIVFFMWTGIKPAPEYQDTVSTIQYLPFVLSDNILASLKAMGKDYVETLKYTLSIIPFSKYHKYVPLGFWTQFLSVGTTIAFSLQFALMLFAIRRRFKR